MFFQRRRRIAKLAHREAVVKRLKKRTALKPKPYLTGIKDSRGSRPGFCRK
jgi:hypothetical protein